MQRYNYTEIIPQLKTITDELKIHLGKKIFKKFC
jgi:hypothetical protein